MPRKDKGSQPKGRRARDDKPSVSQIHPHALPSSFAVFGLGLHVEIGIGIGPVMCIRDSACHWLPCSREPLSLPGPSRLLHSSTTRQNESTFTLRRLLLQGLLRLATCDLHMTCDLAAARACPSRCRCRSHCPCPGAPSHVVHFPVQNSLFL